MNLDELRSALTDLDGQLVELVARRQALSEQVAAVKRAVWVRDLGRCAFVGLGGSKIEVHYRLPFKELVP